MSTWIREDEKRKKSWIQSLCENVLKSGYVPKHVAVIMDGNRRYADKNNYKRSVGHLLGFNKVTETLEWCMGLGIIEVTLYAFSLENFKRSKVEIDGLMELARQKFTALLAEKELISKHGLCLRIIGNMDYLPIDIQQLFAEGIHSTKDNNKAFLNICCAYTSREEMTNTMVQIAQGVSKGLIKQSDIDEDLFEKCLYTRHSTEPDLVIRTSGEVRLSDFLLWQSSYSFLSFTKVLWPEYSWCHFYTGIYFFQRNYQAIKKAREERDERRREQRMSADQHVAMEFIRNTNNDDDDDDDSSSTTTSPSPSLMDKIVKERNERVKKFLKLLEDEYDRKIESLLSKRQDLTKTTVDNVTDSKDISTNC